MISERSQRDIPDEAEPYTRHLKLPAWSHETFPSSALGTALPAGCWQATGPRCCNQTAVTAGVASELKDAGHRVHVCGASDTPHPPLFLSLFLSHSLPPYPPPIPPPRSGVQVCGLPVVLEGPGEFGYGTTMTPGAHADVADCRVRANGTRIEDSDRRLG